MKILVTGGTGYIGSHTVVELMKAGHDVVIVDNLSNSEYAVVNKIEKIVGKEPAFFCYDLRDYEAMERLFGKQIFDAVIHFAGLKAVGESMEKPIEYYDNNLVSTIYLLKLMKKYGVNNIVFSSSATVYGMAKDEALTEDDTSRPINTYAATKSNIEDLLYFTSLADKDLIVSSLRYFNPIGAHESGLIGDAPTGYPNNLLPFIGDVAVGKREKLNVFGNDYDTPDGTCIRDYIHVVDLANAHLAALENNKTPGFTPFNIGTGKGTSVLEMVNAFEKATGVKIPYEIVGRRSGDAKTCYANASKANEILKWHAVYDVETMCRDYWNFKKNN